jgi:polar amino acid transport system substrate-binding protein
MIRRKPLRSLVVATALAVSACSTPGSTPNTGIHTPPSNQSATTAEVATSAARATSSVPSAATTTAASCFASALKTKQPGVVTVATGSPANKPWFSGNEPDNGKGFESAIAFAVALQLGYPAAKVRWVDVSFDSVIAPTPKSFDFAINQVTITQPRMKAVDFSPAYYDVAQAIVALKSNKFATAKDVAGLHAARLGAHTGSKGLAAIKNQVRPAAPVREYPTNALALQALNSGLIDGLGVDLPRGLNLTSGALANTTIIGQLPVTGAPEQFGLVLTKHSPITKCVSAAVTALDHAGTLAQLQTQWLTTSARAPLLH